MSNEFRHGHRRSHYFMAPVWIALALGGMGCSFLLGRTMVADEWSREDNAKLAAYRPGALAVAPEVSNAAFKPKGVEPMVAREASEASPSKTAALSESVWSSPASALEWTAEGVKHDRIEFAVYRNLLRASLAQQDADSHEMAFRSIRDVLQYGGSFADDLKAELKGMAPQVFITTTNSQAGIEAGDALARELRNVGLTVVSRESRDPAQITASKVACYGADTCKDAKALVPLLRGRGYDGVDTDTSTRSEENSDDVAASLYGAKVIRVALMDPKRTQTAVVAPAPGPRLHGTKQAHRTVKKSTQIVKRPLQTAFAQ
jgi:hypothetical protein